MRSKRHKDEIHTVTGTFASIKLDFTPDAPLSEQERSKDTAHYATALAKIHVYLNGKDAARKALAQLEQIAANASS